MLILPSSNVKYRGTITGLRISSVNGTAFIDGANSSVTDLADGNHLIEIYDASGRMLKGVLKAQGAGETLGATELVTNGGFETGDPPTSWNVYHSATLSSVADPRDGSAGSKSINIAYNGVAVPGCSGYSAFSQPQLGLYKFDLWQKYIAGDGCRVLVADYLGNIIYTTNNTTLTWNQVTQYATLNTTAGNYFNYYLTGMGGAGSNVRFDDFSNKQVTAPSTSGATIVSAKAGTTYNFLYKNASFTYNAASYKVIVKKIR